ncbi:MAG: hypothetical protein K0S74_526 [Chlamydiales bacterium]|jgi:hypothetical protein|nr:hypothetical protein [Chlamydiales bacterium]
MFNKLEVNLPFVNAIDSTKFYKFYQTAIVKILKKVINSTNLAKTKVLKEQALTDYLQSKLPIVSYFSHQDGDDMVLSFYLLCTYKYNPYANKFFYDMIQRWLSPGEKLTVLAYFTTHFALPQINNELYSIAELVVLLKNTNEENLPKDNLAVLQAEIKLGAVSHYQANRILEIKGLSVDEKTALIQEHISKLICRYPEIGHDIFTEMQHFLVMCNESFKKRREYRHMSRIIFVHYLFRKEIVNLSKQDEEQHHLRIKIVKTSLNSESVEERKFILGIIVALNLSKDNELFEQHHLLKAIQHLIPNACLVEESFYINYNRLDRICSLYLEVEKEGQCDFSLNEIASLKKGLPAQIRLRIEKRLQPLFMPRNEEEIMRHIVALSNQLKFTRDMPQVVIVFNRQADGELIFTVILLRILKSESIRVEELLQPQSPVQKCALEQSRTVGFVRRSYPKEANVFHLYLDSSLFLREDLSVDLHKARQSIVQYLKNVFGDFRDYNGGMIAKEHEQFCRVQALVEESVKFISYDEFLLENYFYALTPVVTRSVISPYSLYKGFTALLNTIKELEAINSFTGPYYCYLQNEADFVVAIIATADSSIKDSLIQKLLPYISQTNLQLVTSCVKVNNTFYLIYLYRSSNTEESQVFINNVLDDLNKAN